MSLQREIKAMERAIRAQGAEPFLAAQRRRGGKIATRVIASAAARETVHAAYLNAERGGEWRTFCGKKADIQRDEARTGSPRINCERCNALNKPVDLNPSAKARDWHEVEQRIEKMVSDVTDAAHRLMMSGAAPDGVYLYFVPSTKTEWGRLLPLRYDDPVPPRAELVVQQRLPQNKDLSGLRAFIRQRVGRLPLLPSGA